MAQETADAISIPAGGIIWAWIDALAHPEFATFQRWFPLMQVRWRRLSLAVSLFLILATACEHIQVCTSHATHNAGLIPGYLLYVLVLVSWNGASLLQRSRFHCGTSCHARAGNTDQPAQSRPISHPFQARFSPLDAGAARHLCSANGQCACQFRGWICPIAI